MPVERRDGGTQVQGERAGDRHPRSAELHGRTALRRLRDAEQLILHRALNIARARLEYRSAIRQATGLMKWKVGQKVPPEVVELVKPLEKRTRDKAAALEQAVQAWEVLDPRYSRWRWG